MSQNWGRWGADDEVGALNHITDERRRKAAGLVKQGRVVSLARPLKLGDVTKGHDSLRRIEMDDGFLGAATECLQLEYHGDEITHIDSLGHIWDSGGMWGGKDPDRMIQADGLSWGAIDAWREGIVTRGVLLDVVRHRGVDYVESSAPVTGNELDEIARKQQVDVTVGDAVAVHCGREAWVAAGRPGHSAPGLDPSCVDFLSARECTALLWDQNEITRADGQPRTLPVHSVIWRLGMAVIDGAKLDELADVCQERNTYEFMLVTAPLPIIGGSGSPVNPLALL
ncbi:cyclase family protein [Streptomyces sp. NPDC001508]|uniref:cyclase family protein n=1 Tax=Streptomyces sp. NPDC001508 TaxID=3154656 RepID=UPI003333F2C1